MTNTVLISIIGADKVGLVSQVTGRLFDLGANLGDTTFAVLGQGFEFISLAELPAGVSDAEVTTALAEMPELDGAEIRVTQFQYRADRDDSGEVTHRIEISGGDQPGLVARLTEVFVAYGANVVRMNTHRSPGRGVHHYTTRFAVSIPADRADACLAAVGNTAGQMHLIFTWHQVTGGSQEV